MTAPPLTISIVTPSFNQAQFLEDAMSSVLAPQGVALEYVIMDGGSTDGSVEIIRRHAQRLAYWQSTPDGGQYEAINAGFARTTGEIMAWLNSDDKYTPWALEVVAEIFATNPEIDWITSAYPLSWDSAGRAIYCSRCDCSSTGFLQGQHLPHPVWAGSHFIQQESTFWRRRLWDKAGGYVDCSLRYAADFELWSRFAQHAEIYAVETPLGGFRHHGQQKTHLAYAEYIKEADRVLRQLGAQPRHPFRQRLRRNCLRWLPPALHSLGYRLGWLDRVHVCCHSGGTLGRWQPQERYAA